MKTTTRDMMNENKARIVAAFRTADWTLAKVLTQERQKLKRRLKAECVDCGVLIARGLTRCRQHATLHRYYRRSLACLMLLAWPALAGKWTLIWDKNPEPNIAQYQIYEITAGVTNLVGTSPTNGIAFPFVANGIHNYQITAVTTSGIISDPSTNYTDWFPQPPGGQKTTR